MATAVQIQITLDDKGVVSGVDNVNKQLASIGTTIQKSGQQGNLIFTQMTKQHEAVAASADKAGRTGYTAFQRYVDSARSASAGAQTLNQILGLQIPRSVERLISFVPGLEAAFKGALAGTAVLAFGSALGELAIDFDKLMGKAMLMGQRLNALFDSDLRSIMRTDEVEKDMAAVRDRVIQVGNAANLAGKQGFAAITAELKNSNREITQFQTHAFEALRDTFGGDTDNEGFRDRARILTTGIAQMRIDAEISANAKIAELHRQHEKEIRNITIAARQQGSNELLRIALDTQKQLADLDDRRDISVKERAGFRAAIEYDSSQKIIAAERQFHNQSLVFIEEQKRGLMGYAAVAQTEAAKIAQITRDFNQKFGAVFIGNPKDPNNAALFKAWTAAHQDLDNEVTAIHRQGNEQRLDLDRKNLEEDLQLEEKAAVAVVPPWQRTSAAIVLDRDHALRQIQRDLADHVITEQDAARRTAAIWADSNGRMVDDMESKLTTLADALGPGGNIGKYILDQFKKLIIRMVAQWIVGMQQMGSASAGGGNSGVGGLFGALLSSLFGIKLGGGGGMPAPGTPGGPINNFAGAGALGLGALGLGGAASGVFAGTSASPLGNFGTREFTPGGGLSGVGNAASSGSGIGDLAASGISLGLGSMPSAGGGVGKTRSAFGGLFGGAGSGGAGGLLGLAGLGGAMAAGKFGGNIASLGAMISLLIGSPIGAGLIGFGVGAQHGGLAGSLAGAGSGALVGFLVGGPIGALVGGLIGALGGVFGGMFGHSKRKKAAESFGYQQVTAIQGIEDQYKSFQLQYQTAIDDLEKIRADSGVQLKGMKGEGKDVMRLLVGPWVDKAENDIRSIEADRSHRGNMTFGLPQYALGGEFRSWMSPVQLSGGAGLAALHDHEVVVTAQAAQRNRQVLDYINAGGTVGGRGGASGGGATIIVQTLDTKTMSTWLRDGGARLIRQHVSGDLRSGPWQ